MLRKLLFLIALIAPNQSFANTSCQNYMTTLVHGKPSQAPANRRALLRCLAHEETKSIKFEFEFDKVWEFRFDVFGTGPVKIFPKIKHARAAGGGAGAAPPKKKKKKDCWYFGTNLPGITQPPSDYDIPDTFFNAVTVGDQIHFQPIEKQRFLDMVSTTIDYTANEPWRSPAAAMQAAFEDVLVNNIRVEAFSQYQAAKWLSAQDSSDDPCTFKFQYKGDPLRLERPDPFSTTGVNQVPLNFLQE